MELIYINNLEDIRKYGDISVAHGFFDGVHLAHQQLLKKTVEYARKHNMMSGVVTFNRKFNTTILDRDSYIKDLRLSSLHRKLELFAYFNIDIVFVINFNTFKDYDAREYIDSIIVPLGTKHFVMGSDNCFGKQCSGTRDNIEYYANKRFDVTVVNLIDDGSAKISTTAIKQHICNGDVELSSELLNYYYKLSGSIIKGKQLGRKIGFPTTNLCVKEHMIFPRVGVYATVVRIKNKLYNSMTNVGFNPTVDFIDSISIETNIFDFDEDIYNENIELFFIKRIRNEKRFASVDDLMEQIKSDKINVVKVLQNVDSDKLI